ncbi:MAG: glutamate--tRNA ligase family protein [Akkermansiaceae bacterium]|nr:glutamate--tRNA ligase family protein [Akkermansiaceae bacterium]|tara:strand:- start:34 stop:1353 length:1320 start_codon:yes stop_codon:yes gene_type:complete
MPTPVRTRFAPSPTGYLHIGGARTALFNWLYARKHGGNFILRVEDTDEARNTEEARQAIFSSLEWLGIDWDEGHEAGGDCGPYFQSQRQDIYATWFKKLQDAGRVYEDDGAWRFRFERKPITMQDLVCGEVTIDYTDESNTPDMVVRRSDGSFVFHFVNVVDDLEMGLTHVIRGEDHLMNTPKHLQLFEAFGKVPPAYAHIPLILNADGSKMSKRDTGAAVHEYPDRGFLSDAVINFIALLGWSPKDDSEIFPLSELIERFSLEGINRSPSRFDWDKATWMNQQHLLKLPPESFAEAGLPYLQSAGMETPDNFTLMAKSVQEKVQLLSEVPEAIRFYLGEGVEFDPPALEKLSGNEAAPKLLTVLAENFRALPDWTSPKDAIATSAEAEGLKPGKLMFPLRVALSGKTGGPDLGDILSILGRDESIRRIEQTIATLQDA